MNADNDLFDRWAESYDSESIKVQWHGPVVIFGLMYQYVAAGQALLDLGIGTGLGALPFYIFPNLRRHQRRPGSRSR